MKQNQTDQIFLAMTVIFLMFLVVGITDANLRKEQIKPPTATELRKLLNDY